MATVMGKSQRSSSICLSGSQTFDAMKYSVGGNTRESSSGSDSPEVRREAIHSSSTGGSGGSGRPAKSRQNARRSKSERLQGANKPRVKRRDLALDLDRANSGSLAGGLSGNGRDQQQPPPEADVYQSFLRKVPSVGAGLMNDSFNDTPDGSPRLRSIRPASKPPLAGAGSSHMPAISTPDLSPSLIRRATVNSAGVRSTGSRSQLANRNSPQISRASNTKATDQPLNKRATSVRLHGTNNASLYGPSTTVSGNNPSLRRSTFLDVPDSPTGCGEDDDSSRTNQQADEDSYRLRSFDLTRKGIKPGKRRSAGPAGPWNRVCLDATTGWGANIVRYQIRPTCLIDWPPPFPRHFLFSNKI